MKIKVIFTLAALLTVWTSFAQNWQMVWSDEFNNGISSDWVFETGTGSNGWGNNELQYYRRENARTENGNLIIEARRENYGGRNYTSARMKTQGRKGFKYGRIEARISMPAFTGVWPAFWMLGGNINSVGWPKCGEIDVMEHVNTGGNIHGTIHWSDQNGNYANYGGNTSTNVTGFHNYAVEWDEKSIKWFVDGNQYHEVNIANGVNGTQEFHQEYFLLLNMAIGGNWPGFAVDNVAFPAQMKVDYVRVFKKSVTPSGVTNLAGTYYLKNRHSGLFMDVANWGQQDGANILQWHYHGGNNQKFKFVHLGSGVYQIQSVHSGRALDVLGVSTANGANIQQWGYGGGNNQKFIVQNAGGGYYKLKALHSQKVIEVDAWSKTPGHNIQQWTDNNQASGQWELVKVINSTFSKTIQAESYMAMAGVQLEPTTDAGGGQNVGYIDNGDWMAYAGLNIPSNGTYKIEYRVASVGGGKLSADLNGGATVLGQVNIPNTGSWQNWTTVSHDVYMNQGNYNFGLFAVDGGWNINWIKVIQLSSSASAAKHVLFDPTVEVKVFPNPAQNSISLSGAKENSSIALYNLSGQLVMETTSTTDIDISSLVVGVYIVKVYDANGELHLLKFNKL